jgi:hypothetical protein
MCTPQKEWFKRARSFLDVVYVTYKNCDSGMGGPVWAIRLINQKQLLPVMVGINIILSVGNEYVKFAWEFTGKPWRE